MDLTQLRCLLAVAEELHFGRAARRLEMSPSALGRNIRLLEAALQTRLLVRTTRSVSLSQDGAAIIEDVRDLVARSEALARRLRERGRSLRRSLRIGAIDTAAAGLLPMLLQDFRRDHPEVTLHLVEDKTVRLLPKLLSGGIDVAFVRPPLERREKRIAFRFLFHETAVVAVPQRHPLSARARISIRALAGQPLIVPDRRSRPHSHDLTIRMFSDAGLTPVIAQVAEEKQTIVNLVAAGIGLAIVPRWISRMIVPGVRYVPLQGSKTADLGLLPLAAAWAQGARDSLRDDLLATVSLRLRRYAAEA